MKIRSVKVNYILNMLRLTSSILIGLITMPYINRVIGPVYLGKIEYVNAIISYFILFSGLGIPIYGLKLVARVRDNALELSKVICEIFIILLCTSLVSYLVLFGILLNLPLFADYKLLIIIMSSMILLTNIGLEWFFQGIEDQLYITIRTLFIRFITLGLIFLLVKDESDYLYYAIIVVINAVGGNLFNLIKAKSYIDFKEIKFSDLNLIRHIKPSLAMFLASISISLYLQIDTFLLGLLAGDKYVGYYAAANKLVRLVLVIITTVGVVMLPRLTNHWENDRESYYELLHKTFNVLVLISLPCAIYLFIFAQDIISLMAGRQFYPAVLTIKILSPVCVLVACAYFFAFLVLYIRDYEKVYSYIVALSAIASIAINYYMISHYAHNGAAISQVISESLGAIFLVLATLKLGLLKETHYKLLDVNSLKIVFINLILFLIFFYITILDNFGNLILIFIIKSSLFFLFYIVLLSVMKEKLVFMMFSRIKKRLIESI